MTKTHKAYRCCRGWNSCFRKAGSCQSADADSSGIASPSGHTRRPAVPEIVDFTYGAHDDVAAIIAKLYGAALLIHDIERWTPCHAAEDATRVFAQCSQHQGDEEKLQRTLQRQRNPSFGDSLLEEIDKDDIDRVYNVEHAGGQCELAQ